MSFHLFWMFYGPKKQINKTKTVGRLTDNKNIFQRQPFNESFQAIHRFTLTTIMYKRVTFIVTKTQQERTKAATFLFGWFFSHEAATFTFHTQSCVLFCTVKLVFSYTDFVVDYHSSSQFTNNTYPTQQASLSDWRNSI